MSTETVRDRTGELYRASRTGPVGRLVRLVLAGAAASAHVMSLVHIGVSLLVVLASTIATVGSVPGVRVKRLTRYPGTPARIAA